MSKLLDFIAEREQLYFRLFIVLLIVFLFLAAERFQNLVLFVSIGLLVGALYNRWRGGLVEIGAFAGACVGFLLFGVYFVVSTVLSFL